MTVRALHAPATPPQSPDASLQAQRGARLPFADLRPTRRQLLKTGAVAALGLLGASVTQSLLAPSVWGAESAPDLAFFRPKDLPLARATIGTLLDYALPADPTARNDAIARTVRMADRYFSAFTPAVQAEALQAFDALNLAPVRWLGGLWSSWESASPAQVNRYLEGLRTGSLSLSRQMFQLLAGVATVGWYSQPESWAAIGYPGPPNPPRPSGERPL